MKVSFLHRVARAAVNPSGPGVTGGVVTSGQCCQNTNVVPTPPWPCPLLLKLQLVAFTVTLAVMDTVNLRQPGKQTHMHSRQRSPPHRPCTWLSTAPLHETYRRSHIEMHTFNCPSSYLVYFSTLGFWTKHHLGAELSAKMKDDHFMKWLVCVCILKQHLVFVLHLHSYFPGYLDRLYSRPDHMIALALQPCVHRELAEAHVTPYGHSNDETVFICIL